MITVLATMLLIVCEAKLCTNCGVADLDVCPEGTILHSMHAFNSSGEIFLPKTIYSSMTEGGSEEVFSCKIGKNRNAECEAECVGRRAGSCDGDNAFCKSHTCKKGASCRCCSQMVTTTYYAIKEDGSGPFEGTRIECEMAVLDDGPGRKRSLEKRQNDLPSVAQAFVTFSLDTVHVRVLPKSVDVIVRVSSNGWQVLWSETRSDFDYRLPEPVLQGGGVIHIEIWAHNALISQQTFPLPSPDGCSIKHDCYFCWDGINNYNCLPTTSKTIHVVVFLFLICFFIAWIPAIIEFIIWVCKKIKALWCGIWNIGNMRGVKIMTRRVSKAYSKASELIEVEDEPEIEMMEAGNRRGGARIIGGRVILGIACCLALMGGVTACDRSLSGTFTSEDCAPVDPDGIEHCDVSFSARLSLDRPGFKSCQQFTTASGNQLHVNVEWLYAEEIAYPTFEYHTSDWRGYGYSSYACPNADHCSSSGGDNCQDVHASNVDGFGTLTGAYLMNPGRTSCDLGSSYAFHCFFVSDVCIFNRYVLVPKSKDYIVSKMTHSERIHGFKVTVEDHKSVIAEKTFLYGLGNDFFVLDDPERPGLGLSVQVIGEFADQSINTRIPEVVRETESGEVRAGDVSDKLHPVKGTIGDIQSNDPLYHGASHVNAFLFDPNVAIKTIQNHEVIYDFEISGVQRQWSQLSRFPREYNGDVWIVREPAPSFRKRQVVSAELFTLRSNLTRPGGIEVLMSLSGADGRVTITQEVDAVCPNLKNVTASGCWNCEESAILTLSAKSDCKDGLANPYIKGDGSDIIISNAIRLTTAIENHNVTLKPSGQKTNLNVCVSANGRESCREISASFSSRIEDFGNSSTTETGNNTSIETGSDILNSIGTAFDKAFSGVGSWVHWLEVIGVVILGGIILYFLIIILMWAIKLGGWLKPRKNKSS